MSPDPLAVIGELLEKVLPGLITAAGLKGAQLVARHKPGDIPVCNTRIIRQGRGFPWSEQMAIHPLGNGRFEMKALAPDSREEPPKP